jgi:two-component system, chemotaxis family, sensor kinase CheA
MNKDDLAARLRGTFLAELDEQVRAMNTDLLALEAEPGDAERLRSLFRVAHTLKGAARAAAVPAIERACHAVEALLVEARDGKAPLRPEDFAFLFSAADALGDAGRRLKAGSDLADSPLATLAVRLMRRGPVAPPPAPATAPPPSPPPVDARGDGQVRVEAEKLDALLAATGQLFVTGSRVASRPAELHALHDGAARSATDWRRTGRRLRLALERAGAPPSLIHAVTGMENSLREILDQAGRLAVDAADDARALAQATDEVADRVRRIRRRPFAEACEALPRMMRDLATAAGKEIELEVLGGEAEVDRAVLDGLRGALLHLVRNAADHGIEPPDERERLGKPRRGKVSVAAALRGDRFTVTVSDDGVGLDVVAVRAQFGRRGLPVPGDDRELVRALFEGGFSTRAETTAISGRGVGLDAVRAAVARIRGSVDVTWIRGRGTTFTLECPPTIATVRALLAVVGSQLLAIPTTYVERLLRVRPDEIRHAEGRDMIITSEAPVPLVTLARLLPPLVQRSVTGPLAVVLLGAGERRLAVVVDEIVSEQEVLMRPVGRGGESLPRVSGAAILGTGQLALVLNPVAILVAGLGLGPEPGLAIADVTPSARAKRQVLVVDDSITTRTLEQSILEAAGYEVRTAVDGADGWKALQEHECHLVVADVEMPRMDGFALCAAIRASKRFKGLPVVLVTALEMPEHQARGLEVGADAYIGKSSFDQENLLDTIRQLLGAP